MSQRCREVYRAACGEALVSPCTRLLEMLPDDPLEDVQRLDFSDLLLPEDRMATLLPLISSLTHLTWLSFRGNGLSTKFVTKLVDVLIPHPSIGHIDLGGNDLTTATASHELLRLLKTNTRITSLDVTGTLLWVTRRNLLEDQLRNNQEKHIMQCKAPPITVSTAPSTCSTLAPLPSEWTVQTLEEVRHALAVLKKHSVPLPGVDSWFETVDAVCEKKHACSRAGSAQGYLSSPRCISPTTPEPASFTAHVPTRAIPDCPRVWKVVVTGGPCGGKSSGMAAIRQGLERGGVRVFTVPEAATLLFDGGCAAIFNEPTEERIRDFQTSLLEVQMALEDSVMNIARSCQKPAVVLCDRGTMDGSAFCTPELWSEILRSKKLSEKDLKEDRYDMVLHMVTAADGAEKHYTLDNNQARMETPEEARQQDIKLRTIYAGHPRHHIIRNEGDFQLKVSMSLQPILEMVGLRPCVAGVKRFLLSSMIPLSAVPVPYQTFEVCTNTIHSGNDIVLLTEKSDGKTSTFSKQTIRFDPDTKTERIVEEIMTQAMYNSLLDQCEMRTELRKVVTSFIADGKLYEAAELEDDRVILTIYAPEGAHDDLPPWLDVKRLPLESQADLGAQHIRPLKHRRKLSGRRSMWQGMGTFCWSRSNRKCSVLSDGTVVSPQFEPSSPGQDITF